MLSTVGAGENVLMGIRTGIVATHGRTDADGRWTLDVPMPTTGISGARGYRLLTVYSGTETLRATKVAAAVTPA